MASTRVSSRIWLSSEGIKDGRHVGLDFYDLGGQGIRGGFAITMKKANVLKPLKYMKTPNPPVRVD